MRPNDHSNDWHAQETFKSLTQIAVSTLRFSVFSNGGAAVALLAFLANATKAGVYPGDLKQSMSCFVVGVACGGFAHVTAYLTQLRLYGESALGEPQSGVFKHNVFLWLTLILTFVSIALFSAGALIGTASLAGT